MSVKAWEEEIMIPTYEVGKAEKNPLFLEKRVYQGSSGEVYPYPVTETIANEKTEKTYKAVFLENEYLKIMILPQLGGRIQMAFDKIKQRHFIYYNQVIKPALVGLAGPWISGGIEFNWPQHHRPSTFMEVDYLIEKNDDNSITVWVNEAERMTHQKGRAGFTLYSGKAYLEIKGRVYNPSPFPQTFLWWANPAVAVNEHYQSVFPPDVNAVFDHGKRDVSTFPIATGTYYKIDYSAGVDISNYKNIPVPTSYMAIESEFNFVGGYENDTQAGVLHIANHHIAPGKKQWTWGNGDFGRAWDKNLTDENGPYIELMAGVYTDNQPDFSWLQPYEEKSFCQYFLPYRELGIVKNASHNFLLNIESIENENTTIVKVFATSQQNDIGIVLTHTINGNILLNVTQNISSEKIFIHKITHCSIALSQLKLSIFNSKGTEILSIIPKKETEQQSSPQPAQPAQPALLPQEINTCEDLFLTGLHLEQYRHATYSPTDYYMEALKRNPTDIRNNNAMGLWLLRRGKWNEAERFFKQAIETQTKRNPNPYDGEPYYNMGVCFKQQNKLKEAYSAFYKSCWNAAMQDAGFFSCAQISLIENRLDDALYEINQALIKNGHNHQARGLKSTILRKKEATQMALEWIDESLKIDAFNYRCLFEKYLISHNDEVLHRINKLMHNEIHNYEIIALDYINSGCYSEAIFVLQTATQCCHTSPMTFYYMGWALFLDQKACTDIFQKAALHTPDYCFPNRIEAIHALQCAQNVNPTDSKAPYYMGNLWYDKRQYFDAIRCWEQSVKLDSHFPTPLRNLALAAFNKQNMPQKALHLLRNAFELDVSDARLLFEFDQLKKRLCFPHSERLAYLEQHISCVLERDDLYLERITLYNQLGEYQKANELIIHRIFHPWEGGEGKVVAQYQICILELAKQKLAQQNYSEAIELLFKCLVYPSNLGEGKLHGTNDSDFYYFLGLAFAALGKTQEANIYWTMASEGEHKPAAAIFYNDQKPDKIFYQALSINKLGNTEKANSLFQNLIDYAQKHQNETIKLDYFAVSLPDLLIWDDNLTLRNYVHCLYLAGLGSWGMGNKAEALDYFSKAMNIDINHQGIQIHTHLLSKYEDLIYLI